MNETMHRGIPERGIRGDSVQMLITDLSNGQRQAIAIARALASEARIIVMGRTDGQPVGEGHCPCWS
jgi:ABC-type sugar transport system ATPase subunit